MRNELLILSMIVMLSGCSSIKPIDLCLKSGVLMDLVNVDICGTVGDGEFDPEVDIREADEEVAP